MKAIITNYRYWVLNALALVILLGLIAVPQDNIGTWLYIAVLFGSKLIAILALTLFFILYLHWQDNGEIPELTKFVNEEE